MSNFTVISFTDPQNHEIVHPCYCLKIGCCHKLGQSVSTHVVGSHMVSNARLATVSLTLLLLFALLLLFVLLLLGISHLLQDWDVFYLKIGCCHKLGQNVSKHLRPVYGTAGAFSYMMTPSFARKALKAARDPRLNSWVDIILMSMGRHFEGNMYAVQPPLVLGDQSLNSTLTAHYIDPSKDTDWERKWMEFGHWGRLSGAAARWNSK